MSTRSRARRRSIFLALAAGAVGTAIGLSDSAQAATDVWTNQAGTGNWSTSPSDKNWSILGVQSPYTDGDNVIFNDVAGPANTAVDLVGTLNPATINVADPTLNYTLFGSGLIGSGNGTGLIKSGGGALTIANSNPNTYLGGTTVLAGTLKLSLVNLASPTNLIASGSALAMDGGSLVLIGGSTTSSQTFNVTTLEGGGSTISANGPASTTLSLSNLTRVQGATVDFTLPITGAISVAATNTYGFGASVILGGYATVGSGSSWATTSAGNIVALGAGGYTADTWFSQDNTDITASDNFGSVAAPTNSLRFNAPVAATVLVQGLGSTPAVITSGGILMTAGAGAVSDTISGSITSGDNEHDVIINQWDPAGTLMIANSGLSGIADNGATPVGLTKSGPGEVDIQTSNTYSGPTIINGGVLDVSFLPLENGGLPSGIGQSSGAASNLVLNGGTLRVSGGAFNAITNRLFTVGPNGGTLDGSGNNPMVFNDTAPIAFLQDAPTTLTLTGTFATGATNSYNQLSSQINDPDPGGKFKTSLVKNGSGAWLINNTNNFTGGTVINDGILKISNANALGTGPVTLNSSGTLGGDGSVSGPILAGLVTVNNGGSIVPGDPTNMIFQNGLVLNSGAGLTYTLNTAGIPNEGPPGGNDLITSTGNLTISTNIPVSVNPGASFGAGTYPILQYGSLTNNSSGFTGWGVDMLSAPPGLGAGQYQTYNFSNDVSNSSIDLNVHTSASVPTLPTGSSTTIVQQANTTINNSAVNNPVVNILGGAGGNGGAGGPGNTGFYVARGTQPVAKAFSFGWIPLIFQLPPGTPYFVSSGIQVGDPAKTGIPISPNAPYTTNPPFNPPGTGQVSIGGNVVGAIYPAGTNPTSAAPDDWLPAYYLAPLIVVADPPATPVPTYWGETYANPNGLTDIYLADQVGGEDELPGMLDADAAGGDDKFDYQGSFLSLVQSDFPSITDLSQLSDAQWSEFDGSYGWDPSNDIAWSIDDVPDADYTVIGILPEPGSLSLLAIASAGLLARRRRPKKL